LGIGEGEREREREREREAYFYPWRLLCGGSAAETLEKENERGV